MNAFHIYAFTLVSGYLFYYLKIEQGRYEKFNTFLAGKVKRLIVPYVFVCAIWVIPVAELFFRYDLDEVLIRYALGTNPNQLWFLLMLFWVYMIVWPLAGVFDRKPAVGAAIVVAIYAVGMISSRFIPNYFYIWTGCEYVLFFWLGFMIRKMPHVFRHIKWYVWLTCFVIFFILWDRINSGGIHSVLEILVHIFGAIAAFESLSVLAERINWNATWYKELSSKTMPMYLFHQQFIYFVIYWLNGKTNPFLNAGINFVLAIVGSYLISSALMKWRITRFLIGEK
jgi:hypothetical protein